MSGDEFNTYQKLSSDHSTNEEKTKKFNFSFDLGSSGLVSDIIFRLTYSIFFQAF